MTITNDDRQQTYSDQAEAILDKYLKMKDDEEGFAKTVKLDRRYFGNNFNTLPNTKTIGW